MSEVKFKFTGKKGVIALDESKQAAALLCQQRARDRAR